MIGDVNLFLSTEENDDKSPSAATSPKRRAEMEIMIAEPSARRQGYALGTMQVFLSWASEALNLPPSAFFARVGAGNAGSIALFEKLGFRKGQYVAVFDEQQMDWAGGAAWSWPRDFVELDDPAEAIDAAETP